MKFVYDDGGRAAAGFKGITSDCVCRAIAIACELPYQEAYELVNQFGKTEKQTKKRKSRSSARTGVYKGTIREIMRHLGWEWTPTMGFGTGCRVHLRAHELPPGRLVVQVSRHLTAVVDGVIHDTYDPQRLALTCENADKGDVDGSRCVYGYWKKGK